MNLLEKLIKEIDIKNAVEHIHWLTKNTPRRLSGYGQDKKAAEYVYSQMKKYGLETRMLEFDSYVSRQEHSELRVIYPELKVIDTIPCAHIASTHPEGINTELVYIGAGAYEDYENKDVKGKIVLIEVSFSPATPEKARIAAEMGAVGLIAMNWGNDEDVIANRALKAVWGNPTEKSFKEIPQIAGLGVTRTSGLYLKELCENNDKVEIVFKAESTREWKKLLQPMGIIRGKKEPSQFMLIGGHLDAWEPGVTCNATGNAIMLEMARVFEKYKNQLERSLYFVFYNGHEIAEAAGSTWLLDTYWDDLRDNCISYMVIDSPGLKETEIYGSKASREVSEFINHIGKEILDVPINMQYLTKTGDQSLFGIGITSMTGRMAYTQEYIDNSNGATLGWWNHTIEDGLDKYDVEILKEDIKMDVHTIERIINSKIFPYNYSVMLKDIIDKLKFIQKESNDILKLDSMIEKSYCLVKNTNSLNECKKSIQDENIIKKLNSTLLKLSRLLTGPFYTYCDNYSQDSYGLTILSKPIPLIYSSIRLSKMERGTQEYNILMTELVKNKNRLSDALQYSIECIDNFFCLYDGMTLYRTQHKENVETL